MQQYKLATQLAIFVRYSSCCDVSKTLFALSAHVFTFFGACHDYVPTLEREQKAKLWPIYLTLVFYKLKEMRFVT